MPSESLDISGLSTLEKKRNLLKKLVTSNSNHIKAPRAKTLLENMSVFEHLLRVKAPAFVQKERRYARVTFRQELIRKIHEMIDKMSFLDLEKAISKSDELTEILNGNFVASDLKDALLPAVETKPVTTKERSSTLDEIKNFSHLLWKKLPWGDFAHPVDLNAIKQEFINAGLQVKVEFFRPKDPEHGGDYIIISNDNRGIVIPKYGIKLDYPFNAALFVKPGPAMEFPVDTITAFPEVEYDYEHRFGESRIDYWKIVKIGEIGIPEGV